MDWRYLPYGAVKAARNGAVGGFAVVGKNRCVQCWREMWTCDIERENLCEEDDYYLRSRNWDLKAERAKRQNMKVVNPFGEPDNRTTLINPFRDLE